MERGRSGIQMVVFTKETGRMGTDTGKEDKITLMERDTREGTRTVREKAREYIRGQTAENTKEGGRTIRKKAREYMRGQTAENTKETTRKARCMERE